MGFSPRPIWFQLIMRAPESAADLMTAWLMDAGATGVEYLDQHSPAPPDELLEKQLEIRASFGSIPSSVDELLQGAAVELKRLAALLPGPWSSGLEFCPLDEEDWSNTWREHSHPVRIGRFFIHPGWIDPDPEAPFSVRIDPGMAFGTGLHPSTRMCMMWIDRIMQDKHPMEKVLDVGCGSGVLAIGAALAGVKEVVAVDTDPEACRVTRENTEFNKVANRVRVVHGGLQSIEGSFSLVLANILSGVLLELAGDLVRLLEPGGDLVLAGILGDEGQMVQDAFEEKGMVTVDREDETEWCSLRMSRG